MRKTKPTSTPVKIRWPRVTERNGPKVKGNRHQHQRGGHQRLQDLGPKRQPVAAVCSGLVGEIVDVPARDR